MQQEETLLCYIYFKNPLHALRQGDPCLGIIEAETEEQAAVRAKEQGIGGDHDIVAVYVPAGGVAHRDAKTGWVRAVFPSGVPTGDTALYPFGYFDNPRPGGIDPEILRLTLKLRIARIERIREDFPDWGPYREKLARCQAMLAEATELVQGRQCDEHGLPDSL